MLWQGKKYLKLNLNDMLSIKKIIKTKTEIPRYQKYETSCTFKINNKSQKIENIAGFRGN